MNRRWRGLHPTCRTEHLLLRSRMPFLGDSWTMMYLTDRYLVRYCLPSTACRSLPYSLDTTWNITCMPMTLNFMLTSLETSLVTQILLDMRRKSEFDWRVAYNDRARLIGSHGRVMTSGDGDRWPSSESYHCHVVFAKYYYYSFICVSSLLCVMFMTFFKNIQWNSKTLQDTRTNNLNSRTFRHNGTHLITRNMFWLGRNNAMAINKPE